MYQLINIYIENNYEMSIELRVLLNRVLLIVIVLGLFVTQLFNKKKISFFNNKPDLDSYIVMPFHSIRLSYFMIIGLFIPVISFFPFIMQQELSYIKSIIIFCLLFSIFNATLEELIWRGFMLSNLKEYVSVTSAIIITSIGFGLLHLAVGIPFIVSLLFSFGGIFYAFVVLNTNSIYPSIILHFFINVGMVLSGFIL
ncbi:CPBP family intramembrane metalloprotease [Cytobacillus suaedae]|nr:CPBP family intramembrane metalloprotease [Cytobacillus suaedae]